jgi:hypothetical protein
MYLSYRIHKRDFYLWPDSDHGLGFGVWSLGFRVYGFGFRIFTFGLMVIRTHQNLLLFNFYIFLARKFASSLYSAKAFPSSHINFGLFHVLYHLV